MRYKNIRTGAIIDSPFNISGDDWEAVKTKAFTEEVEEVLSENEEYVEEEVDLEEMTNKQLDEFAKKHKIELTAEDKKNKPARIAAIVAAFE
ncbi:hypothetical protein [Sporosarcina sp. 6E9]|uniref:hypothetical protein n=1 Tax=Sporosarcina sp. 6E9 TaxID=2819235 RepID=UPI001AD18253|nr:hypothetical protein [Sporosarcina sp. 6E9]MBO1910071.1 hypothetical protein [Microvirga sp. 3-52]